MYLSNAPKIVSDFYQGLKPKIVNTAKNTLNYLLELGEGFTPQIRFDEPKHKPSKLERTVSDEFNDSGTITGEYCCNRIY